MNHVQFVRIVKGRYTSVKMVTCHITSQKNQPVPIHQKVIIPSTTHLKNAANHVGKMSMKLLAVVFVVTGFVIANQDFTTIHLKTAPRSVHYACPQMTLIALKNVTMS